VLALDRYKAEEDTVNDSETDHASENVHYVAVQGDGILTARPVPTTA